MALPNHWINVTDLKVSYVCSYVHYRKLRRSLQEHAGSFISRDGTFGAVVWKGSVELSPPVHDPHCVIMQQLVILGLLLSRFEINQGQYKSFST